jgi:hypothetical protein
MLVYITYQGGDHNRYGDDKTSINAASIYHIATICAQIQPSHLAEVLHLRQVRDNKTEDLDGTR